MAVKETAQIPRWCELGKVEGRKEIFVQGRMKKKKGKWVKKKGWDGTLSNSSYPNGLWVWKFPN